MSYRAAVLTQPGTIAIEDRDDLHPGGGEVRIRVDRAGVCGTDLAIFNGEYAADLPMVLGHEFAGVVDAVGPGADESLSGRRAVAEINNTCLARGAQPCAACAAGLDHHCLRRTVLGIVGADGAFAEQIVLPAANVHGLPDSVGFEQAIFVEPLAAALQVFEISPPQRLAARPGGAPWVVVLGVGRLGTLVCAAACELGCRVIAIDRDAPAIRRAKQFGARHAFGPSERNLAALVRGLTGGLGADMVVEATGSPDGLGVALELVRPRGVIHLKTTSGRAGQLDTTRVVVNEVQIHTSRCGPFDKAIGLLAAGKIDAASLIEASYPLAELASALGHARRTSGKVQILMR